MTFELIGSLIFGAVLCAIIFTLCALSLLGIMQQGGYSVRAFARWYYRRGNMFARRISLLTLSLVLLTALFDICFSFLGAPLANLISILPLLIVGAMYVLSSRRALKVPVRGTGRLVRLALCLFVLTALVAFGAEALCYFVAEAIAHPLAAVFRFVPVMLLPLLLAPMLMAAVLLMNCYELPHNRRYLRRAARALAESACVRVGITGSFGKTSVKMYVAQLLSAKYKVIATPSSYNTPMGVARAVNEGGLDCDIFLAEMGARKPGDIAELCDLVAPAYGVVTGVGNQHLASFGSEQAIRQEKGVLAARAQHVVLGATAAGLAQGALTEGADFGAENVVCSTEGVAFDLVLAGERVRVTAPLMGELAAEDIALAAALCFQLGMTVQEIASRVPALKGVAHRLEKIEANGITILDDAYNANERGAANAVRTLRLFPGRKFIVTPGLVELGELEEAANTRLGAQLTGLEVVLVGETLVLPVQRGYLGAGGDPAHIRILPTLERAKEFLAAEVQAGDCVLFLNDLPDLF